MKTGKYLIVLLLSLLLHSCNEENPDLVNPPDKTASIRFRFLNLGYDNNPKVLEVTEGVRTPSIYKGGVSESFNPLADTGFVRIYKNDNTEFEQTQMVRFIRNTNYTFLGLSSSKCDDRTQCKIDTIIPLRTTSAIPENNFESLLKFINAFPDSTVRITLRMGCPNGEPLFPTYGYKQYSFTPITVRSGALNFSVFLTSNGAQGPINTYLDLYSVDLSPKGQYTIIAHEDESGNLKISILDENDLSPNAIKPAQIVPLRTTEIRTVNLSTLDLSVYLKQSGIVDDNVPSLTIDDFRSVEVCKSSSSDTLEIVYNNSSKLNIVTSLDVLSKYTLIVYDSADVKAGGAILIPPPKLNVDIEGKALVRVVNTLESATGINVSIGARLESDRVNFVNGFSSGISLASRLRFTEVSQYTALNPGPGPISVFTASDPARLLFATNTYFEANKQYLIIVTKDDFGNIKLTIVDEDDQSKKVDYLIKGIFFQLVNATTDNSNINVNINSISTGKKILENATVQVSNSIATVIDEDFQIVNINGKEYTTNATDDERVICVASGTQQDFNLITSKFKPLSIDQNNIFRVRFVNATLDMQYVKLRKNLQDSVFFESVEKNTFSSYNVETREQKPTFFFFEDESKGYISRFSDVLMSLGKSYSIILYGNSGRECFKYYDSQAKVEPNCYSFIIQQEF